MKESSRRKQQKWHIIDKCKDQLHEKSSFSSRDSNFYSRYTPTKVKKQKPEQSKLAKLNLAVLQNPKMVPLQHSSRVMKADGKQSKVEENKSLSIQPVSLKFLAKRTNSLEAQNNFHANYLTRRSEMQNQNYQDNAIIKKYEKLNNDYFQSRQQKQSQGLKVNQLRITQALQQRKDSILKRSFDLSSVDLKGQSIETIFENCIKLLNMMEAQITSQRGQMHKLLQKKHQHFLHVKEKIIRQFVQKQKRIHNPQLRKILRQYLPVENQKKNGLTRIKSQGLFNRGGGQFSQKQKNNGIFLKQFNLNSEADQSLKNTSPRKNSIRSRGQSIFKKNFETLFGTINRIKQQLSDTGDQLLNRINGRRALPTKQKPQNPNIYYQKQQIPLPVPVITSNNKLTSNKQSLGYETLKSQKKSQVFPVAGEKSPLKKSSILSSLQDAKQLLKKSFKDVK